MYSLEKRVQGAYTRMLQDALDKSWRGHLSNKELGFCIPRVTYTLQKQRLRSSGH